MRQVVIILTFCVFIFLSFRVEDPLNPEFSIAKLLEALGDEPLPHKPNLLTGDASISRGRDIVINGMSKAGGKKSKRQSKYFTCIACHNIEREDPQLSNPSPEARLKYTNDQNLPFLQGSALYGVVNRRSFYNGDYEKKYGDLVKPARNDLRQAIQLCAVECSQGRKLRDFELESVLAYLWTIDLKLKDLFLTPDELELVEHAFDTGNNRGEAIKVLRSKYLDSSPATFVDPPADRSNGNQLTGRPENGAIIYKNSCQHCHFENKYSFLLLDDSKLTFQHLQNKAGKYSSHSMYQVIRYGTPPKGGKKAYMPQYTKEKMTDQQMADLRAFIDESAQ
ncbi:MAG: cytochrome c [Saprospiraceae bacterium]|nr:cytochrome c [Saprospiraceae bacterium]